MRVRLATGKDLAQVLELERGTAAAPHWAEAEYAGMLSKKDSGEVLRALFVAEEEALLAGFCAGKVAGEVAEIESVVVRADVQRRGWGRALCRAAMEWAREGGAGEMELEVRAGSAGAISLYKSLGFVEVGWRTAYYREPVEDAVLMRCGLGGLRQDPNASHV